MKWTVELSTLNYQLFHNCVKGSGTGDEYF